MRQDPKYGTQNGNRTHNPAGTNLLDEFTNGYTALLGDLICNSSVILPVKLL